MFVHYTEGHLTIPPLLFTSSLNHLLNTITKICNAGCFIFLCYDHVSPLTDAGRLFAVFFGLIGIPLMFITAADIGKFLSEMVTRSYGKFLELTRYLTKKFFPPKNGQNQPPPPRKTSQTPEDILFGLDQGDDDNPRVELPIFAYFGLILGYCAIGGLLFNSFENGPVWSFIHGFFFSFNTITTIGLGNVMVRNVVYLVLIVIYCIVGLAVITMCVDLASAQLKVLFTKLHYFGRKFRGARSTFMTMSDDIREAIRIIAALKKNRPSKEQITLEDIKKFLEIEQQYMARPFVPTDIQFLKWVDEDDLSVSNRSGSFVGVCPTPPPPPQLPYASNGTVGSASFMDSTMVYM